MRTWKEGQLYEDPMSDAEIAKLLNCLKSPRQAARASDQLSDERARLEAANDMARRGGVGDVDATLKNLCSFVAAVGNEKWIRSVERRHRCKVERRAPANAVADVQPAAPQVNPAKETADRLARTINAASPEKPAGWTARAWQPARKDWARVYVRANSRSARDLGYFFVKADGTVVSYNGKQQLALNRAAAAAGMSAADFTDDA